ncbi:NAD(P)-binding Rossmann-fold superfamily protein isoform X2 [Tasmannia lanceolata]|uniref:NAD(P)-binding Rossmann-fold superfamily protein isoform X2 n=1 Tax=Tasmannia lanceolata TaxID=3420 RepID=UPI0040640520
MGFDWEALQFICLIEFWRMGVIWSISLIFSYFQLLLTAPFGKTPCSYPRHSMGPPASITSPPICIITGATSGLGKAAAKCLSNEGYYVILAGRSLHLLSKTIQEIEKQHGDARLKGFQIDLSSFQSIVKFKSSVEQWLVDSNLHPSIQLLINNAGILATSCRLTPDGYDQMMETNYIGAFALTNLLLPLLRNSPMPSRIVNVTSFTHRCVSDVQINEETLSGKKFKCLSGLKQYPFANIYEYSKFCVLLFSYELHRQLCSMEPSHQISVMAADPGVVETGIMREVPPHLSQLAFTVLRFLGLLQSPEHGVGSIIDAALAPKHQDSTFLEVRVEQ